MNPSGNPEWIHCKTLEDVEKVFRNYKEWVKANHGEYNFWYDLEHMTECNLMYADGFAQELVEMYEFYGDNPYNIYQKSYSETPAFLIEAFTLIKQTYKQIERAERMYARSFS